MIKKAIISLFVVLALASCTKEKAGDEALKKQPKVAQAETQEAPAISWDASGGPVAGTSITVTPNPVNFCTEELAVVEVSWDVTAAASKYVQLWVNNNGEEKLWLSVKEQAGSRQTGKWAKAGLEFVAVNPSTKKAINSVKVESIACQ